MLGPLLFLLYTSELFSILENMLIGYADDSTLMAIGPSPGFRVTVAESLIRDLGRVSECCDLWRMKLNASKTKTMIVLKESVDLVILGVTFDSKMTFESIFAPSPEHLLKDSVSRGSPTECYIIDRFYGDAFRGFSCPFWSTLLQCGARLPIHTLNYWTVQSVVPGF